jgi:hypothetical protein
LKLGNEMDNVNRAVWVGYGPGLEKEMKSTIRRLLDESP